VGSSEFEGQIRGEVIRRDMAPARKPQAEQAEGDNEIGAGSINALLQRVAGNTFKEIDRLIDELQGLRNLLQSEGQRVQREIIKYAQLSQAAMKSTKVIAEGMTQLQSSACGQPGLHGPGEKARRLAASASRRLTPRKVAAIRSHVVRFRCERWADPDGDAMTAPFPADGCGVFGAMAGPLCVLGHILREVVEPLMISGRCAPAGKAQSPGQWESRGAKSCHYPESPPSDSSIEPA
jgi:hypothetical protein